MFDWKRLSKEDYELFGDCSVWEFWDIAVVLSAFTLEESGIYGINKEIFTIRRLIFDDSSTEIEKAFCDNWSKWTSFIMIALASCKISYANVISINDKIEPLEPIGDEVEGEIMVRVRKGLCCINARDFLDYLNDVVDSSEISIDLDSFAEYLDGRGPAPSSKVMVEKIEVLPTDYHKNLAKKLHDKTEPLKSALFDFLLDDLSGNCTCTKKLACKRIYYDKFKNEEIRLKRETGYGYLSFTREVSKVLKKIESCTPGINRHENTKGFSYDKLPPCTKHPEK